VDWRRTRQPGGAHLEYCRGIQESHRLKCGPSLAEDELIKLIDVLNPENKPGRLTLILPIRCDKVAEKIPQASSQRDARGAQSGVVLRSDARQSHQIVHRIQDPALRPRDQEIRTSSTCIGRKAPTAGGVHLELTGKDVTECLAVRKGTLGKIYPRVTIRMRSATQREPIVELAFLIAEGLRQEARGPW